MSETVFVYVTHIRTTPEKLWAALVEPAFTRQYWWGTWQDKQDVLFWRKEPKDFYMCACTTVLNLTGTLGLSQKIKSFCFFFFRKEDSVLSIKSA